MADFSVTIKTPELGQGKFFAKFWEVVARNKAQAEKEIKDLLQEFARDGHRQLSGRHYQKQTGQLAKSTKAEGSFNLGDSIKLYVDRTQVDYAQYIIEPQYFNDPFIDESLKYNMPRINEIIIELYTNAINEWNRQRS